MAGISFQKIQNPTFKILRQANAGPGAARNLGLAEATGEFIHFFDSDDIAAPNKHEVQLRALLDTGADIAYGPWCKGRFVENERPRTDGGELMADPGEVASPQVVYPWESMGQSTSQGKNAKTLKNELTTKKHENTRKGEKHGDAQGTCAGAAFSNPSTSELARDIQNTSLIRSADGPSEALDARRSTLAPGTSFQRGLSSKPVGFLKGTWCWRC